MTQEHHTFNTVTVPVGLGGKTTPYVADPAPTVLVDLASVEADIKSDGVREAADFEARAVVESASQQAIDLVEEAAAKAEAIIEAATGRANQMKAEQTRRQAELDDLRAELEDRQTTLATRSSELEEREQEALGLLGKAERDSYGAQEAVAHARDQASETLAEATAAAETLLADAQTQVDSLLADAQHEADTRAEAHLADARDQAEALLTDAQHHATTRAEALLADARYQVDSLLADAQHQVDSLLTDAQHQAEALLADAQERAAEAATRTEDIQSVHLIEIQVLREREMELLDRIARLEAAQEDNNSQEPDEATEVDLDQELADLSLETSGRHVEARTETPGPSASSRLASYTPLTEQLSTTAFRTPLDDKDRRGRKRR